MAWYQWKVEVFERTYSTFPKWNLTWANKRIANLCAYTLDSDVFYNRLHKFTLNFEVGPKTYPALKDRAQIYLPLHNHLQSYSGTHKNSHYCHLSARKWRTSTSLCIGMRKYEGRVDCPYQRDFHFYFCMFLPLPTIQRWESLLQPHLE